MISWFLLQNNFSFNSEFWWLILYILIYIFQMNYGIFALVPSMKSKICSHFKGVLFWILREFYMLVMLFHVYKWCVWLSLLGSFVYFYFLKFYIFSKHMHVKYHLCVTSTQNDVVFHNICQTRCTMMKMDSVNHFPTLFYLSLSQCTLPFLYALGFICLNQCCLILIYYHGSYVWWFL